MKVALARDRLLQDFGLKAVREDSFTKIVGEFQAARALDDDRFRLALANDPALRRALAARLSVGESFFLRQAEQLECIVEHAGRLWLEGRKPVIWSAGCARGEEPYTVALLLTERWGSPIRQKLTILGSDIDAQSLKVARSGLYGSWSFRGVPYELLHKYFRACKGGHVVADELLGWPVFEHLSIQEHLAVLGNGSVDVVLFRNVGIYLTEESLESIHAGFARVLAPDGLLLQSATDPAPSSERFGRMPDATHGQYVHAAAAARARAKLSPPSRSPSPVPFDSGPPESCKLPVFQKESTGVTRRVLRDSPPKSERQPAAAPPPSSRRSGTGSCDQLQSCRDLADAGRIGDAVEAVSELLRANPRLREGYVLRGQLHLHDGKDESAVEDLRAALFLEPGNLVTRYWYSVALERCGLPERANEQRRVIESALSGRVDAHLLEDGETTVSEMRSLVGARREKST